MDEVRILRALIAGEPQHHRQAEAEVWSRLQGRGSRAWGWSPPRRTAIAFSLATLFGLTAIAVVVFTGSIGVPTAEAACSREMASPTVCLHALAQLAASAGTPGRIVYQRALGLSPAVRVLPLADKAFGLHLSNVVRPFSVREANVTETWIDRTTWHGVRRVSSEMSFPTPADRAAWRASRSPDQTRIFGHPEPVRISRIADSERWYVMDFGLLQKATDATHPDTALPNDAAAVLRLLQRLAPATGLTGAALSLPGEDPLLTPAQRAAIFKALVHVPGVRVLGTMSDALGRKGVGVATPWRGHGVWLTLYDPRTSRMLADGAVISPGASKQLDHPQQLAHLTWLWTYTIDAATAPGVLQSPPPTR